MTFRNPFKPHHGSKKTAISKTAERGFEREVKKFEQLEEHTKTVYKDMKKSTDCQASLNKNELKMAQNFSGSNLCKEEEDLQTLSTAWLQGCQNLETLIQEHNAICQRVVTEPMKKFSTIFPSVQQAVRKREQSLQEYNKCQAKVDKYQERERTGANIVKLDASKKALAAAREEYDCQSKPIAGDLPKLYEGRIDYFQPSFQALIKAQLQYYTDAHKIYSDLSALHQTHDGEQDADELLQQKLADIRGLSITADD